jgi:hypothetical protein
LRDIVGIIIASFTIISSHNIFHKIRLQGWFLKSGDTTNTEIVYSYFKIYYDDD